MFKIVQKKRAGGRYSSIPEYGMKFYKDGTITITRGAMNDAGEPAWVQAYIDTKSGRIAFVPCNEYAESAFKVAKVQRHENSTPLYRVNTSNIYKELVSEGYTDLRGKWHSVRVDAEKRIIVNLHSIAGSEDSIILAKEG